MDAQIEKDLSKVFLFVLLIDPFPLLWEKIGVPCSIRILMEDIWKLSEDLSLSLSLYIYIERERERERVGCSNGEGFEQGIPFFLLINKKIGVLCSVRILMEDI